MGEKPTPNGVAYWRGTVDQKLESLEAKVDKIYIKIDKLIDKVDALDKSKETDAGKFVEWEYIRNKITVPIALAGIMFLLFTIMPSVFVLIYFLPRIGQLSP